MSARASVEAGVRMALARVSGKAGIGVQLAALVAVLVFAFVERRAGSFGASDRTVAGLFRMVVPLTCFALSHVVAAGQNVRDAVWPAARFGLHRGWVSVGQVLGTSAFCAACFLVIAVVGVAAARAGRAPLPHEMSLAADLLATAWIAPLTAAAYVAWFSFGGTFGKQGGGRSFVLAADFMFGSVGLFALLLPRGSAYNLIGLDAQLELGQRAASGVLGAVFVLCSILSFLRCRA